MRTCTGPCPETGGFGTAPTRPHAGTSPLPEGLPGGSSAEPARGLRLGHPREQVAHGLAHGACANAEARIDLFAQAEPRPGYIWALMAQATLARRLRSEDPAAAQRQADDAWRTFTHLSPAHRSADPMLGPLYLAEPYAIAGDIYSQPPHAGRAGWTWYTGSASWLHRAAIESIFGLEMNAQTFSLTPSLPSHWPQAELTLRRGALTLQVTIRRLGVGTEGEDSHPLSPGEIVVWRGLVGRWAYAMTLGN
ncbi:GH36-type glycosyl hydrolase domain-containing protein [Leptothrix sp. BB-4]